MRRCYFCNHGGNKHTADCPKGDPQGEKDYRAGWNEGRSGKPYPANTTQAYILGWVNGDAALDEAQNGCG